MSGEPQGHPRFPARKHSGGFWFDDYELTGRTYTVLKNEGVKSAAEVRARSEQEWMLTPNAGKRTVAELERLFGPLGGKPPPKEQWWDFE